MYPNLYYAFKDLFGVELPALRFVNSFGFFVAMAFLVAAYLITKELRRKERAAELFYQEEKVEVGKPASIGELLLNFVLGFILGYKIIGLFLQNNQSVIDPQEFIISAAGNPVAGILLGLFFAGMKWWEKNKQKLHKPEIRKIRIWPHDRVGDIVIIAAVFGFLGAKIFHNLENWKEFQANPIEALLSFSGLTFYGGLICAAAAIIWFARKHEIGVRHLADTMAPALMLAYAIGRIGCQVAGDGDWGILNSAYVSTPQGTVQPVDYPTYLQTLSDNSAYYLRESNVLEVSQVPNKVVKAPSWLPDWMVAFNYPNNVLSEGVPIAGCEGPYCNQLPVPAFPTPFYETVACTLLFLFLWLIRKRITVPGSLFAIYLMVNGLERFLIEKIRVNNKYEILGFHPTQAEIISSLLVLAGIGLYIFLRSPMAPSIKTNRKKI